MQIFIASVHGQEAANAKAAALGLKAGDISKGWETIPAIGGNTFAVKDILKAHGARWHGTCKVWYFASSEAREAALDAVADAQ